MASATAISKAKTPQGHKKVAGNRDGLFEAVFEKPLQLLQCEYGGTAGQDRIVEQTITTVTADEAGEEKSEVFVVLTPEKKKTHLTTATASRSRARAGRVRGARGGGRQAKNLEKVKVPTWEERFPYGFPATAKRETFGPELQQKCGSPYYWGMNANTVPIDIDTESSA